MAGTAICNSYLDLDLHSAATPNSKSFSNFAPQNLPSNSMLIKRGWRERIIAASGHETFSLTSVGNSFERSRMFINHPALRNIRFVFTPTHVIGFLPKICLLVRESVKQTDRKKGTKLSELGSEFVYIYPLMCSKRV